MSELALIKQIRETTGCGIADCSKALKENGGDIEKSIDWLRKKGLSSAAKKTGRVTSEGVIATTIQDNKASLIEVNSETDFVAKNDKFQEFVSKLADESITYGDDIAKFQSDNDGKIKEMIGVIGENITIRRLSSLSVNSGTIVSYLHNKISDNMGKLGVLIALESDIAKDKLEDLGKQIAMHIAATKPEALSIESVSPERLSRETDVLKEQARASGKPENIIEKMIQGRINKFYEEIVLLEQNFVMNDKIKIKDLIADFAKENNGQLAISNFKILVLGEGVEKKENDFAAEVASMTSK